MPLAFWRKSIKKTIFSSEKICRYYNLAKKNFVSSYADNILLPLNVILLKPDKFADLSKKKVSFFRVLCDKKPNKTKKRKKKLLLGSNPDLNSSRTHSSSADTTIQQVQETW